jgi:hypothetical protein
MRKILILLVSLMALLNSWPVSAQEPLRLPAVEVKEPIRKTGIIGHRR